MARATQVRPGQVWTANVSGKPTKVQIISELPPKKAGGRVRFSYKNLSTGRQASGTAGKLKTLVSQGGPADGTPAVTVPASPPPIGRSRARPVRRASAPAGRTSPSQGELANPLSQLEARDLIDKFAVRKMGLRRGYDGEPGSPAYERTSGEAYAYLDAAERYSPGDTYEKAINRGPPLGSISAPEWPGRRSNPEPLGSLRTHRRPVGNRPARRPARQNPSNYPSEVARDCSRAISGSNAQTPGQVMQVVQDWYLRLRQAQGHQVRY